MSLTAVLPKPTINLNSPEPPRQRFRIVSTYQCPQCRKIYQDRSRAWCHGCGARLDLGR